MNNLATKPFHLPQQFYKDISSGIHPKFTKYFLRKEVFKKPNKELKDYEAFDLMHKYDGTFTKSESGLSRL